MITKSYKAQNVIEAFFNDDFYCNGCEKDLKMAEGAYFCYKCDFHKCQTCVKTNCHGKHHHQDMPKCDKSHVLRFINSHAHEKLFAAGKQPIYFKDGSFFCDISNMDDCYSCSKLKLENLVNKQFSCPQSHSMDIYQNAVDEAFCDFCLVKFEDQVIGSCEECQFQVCENCLRFLDQMNLTQDQIQFIMVYFENHIKEIRAEKIKFIDSENQCSFNEEEVSEILNQFMDSLDENFKNFENLNFNDDQEKEIIEKLKNMLERKSFRESHFCPQNHKLEEINNQEFTCCLCNGNGENCFSCKECRNFEMCFECAFQIENIKIQDFKKPFFMKIFENIKDGKRGEIQLKELKNLNLTQNEVQKCVQKFILYLNQLRIKINEKQIQLKSELFHQRDAEDLICKKNHTMTKKPCESDKKCSFCRQSNKFSIFYSCRPCQLDLCESCVNIIDSFQLEEDQQAYVIQLFHQTIQNVLKSQHHSCSCQIYDDDLYNLDITKEKMEEILVGMQNCFQGQEIFRCIQNHLVSCQKLVIKARIRCQICKMEKIINAQKDRLLNCEQCDFKVCDNKCVSMLETLQIEDEKKHELMERFVQILKNEDTLSCDYYQILKNDPERHFILKMKTFLQVQNTIDDKQPHFCNQNHQLLKIKVVDDKPFNCKICNDYIEQNQLKNAFCYKCNECEDFAICFPGCKIQLDQLEIENNLKHIFMDIFQNLKPIQTDQVQNDTPDDAQEDKQPDDGPTNQDEEQKLEEQQIDQTQEKDYDIQKSISKKQKRFLNKNYENEKKFIIDKNSSSLKGIQYNLLITQMEKYVTEFKCSNIGHIFILIEEKPINDLLTKCESCDKVLSEIKEDFKGYFECAECKFKNCNDCYKMSLIKLCNNNHTFAGSEEKCQQCKNTIQNSQFHQCIKCSYFKCSQCLNSKHKYSTKYFIPDKVSQNNQDQNDETQDLFQKGLNSLQKMAIDKINENMVDKENFQCSQCYQSCKQDDDHCYECQDCNIRTCFKCANVEEEVIGVPQQVLQKYSDTGIPMGVTSDKELITVDLTFVSINIIYALFLTLQSSCIASYLGFYSIFMNNQCNASMYVVPEIMQDYFNYPISKEYVFILCTVLAVFLKIASAEYLRLMLLSYLNLEKNQTFFVVALFCVSAPSCLMIPFYTYDHDQCIQKNFMMDMTFSCVVQIICVAVTGAVIVLGFFYISSCFIFGFLDNFEIHEENIDHFSIINKVPFASLILQLLEQTSKSQNPYIRFFIGKLAGYVKQQLVKREIKNMEKLQEKIQKEMSIKQRKMIQDTGKKNIKQNIELRKNFDENIFNYGLDFENYIKIQKEKEQYRDENNEVEEISEVDDKQNQKCNKNCLKNMKKYLPSKEGVYIYFSEWFGYKNSLKGWKKVNNIVKIVLKQILIISSLFFALCMLVIQVCTYQLFQGSILATGGNNELMSLIKLFTYLWVFSQRDQLEYFERLKKALTQEALQLLGKELKFLMKILNSKLFIGQIQDKLNKLGFEELKIDKVYDALNPLIEEEQKRKLAEEKKKKEAKAQAEQEKKDEILRKQKIIWALISQKFQKTDQSKNKSWSILSLKFKKNDEPQKNISWSMLQSIKNKKEKPQMNPLQGILALKQNKKDESQNRNPFLDQLSKKLIKKKVQPDMNLENEELKEGGEPERKKSIYLSKLLNYIDADDSDDEDLKKYCCFKTKKSRKKYKKFCQYFQQIICFFRQKPEEESKLQDIEIIEIQNLFNSKKNDIEEEFKKLIIQMITSFIQDAKDKLPDKAKIFIKKFMSEVIFNKYTPQKFNFKLSDLAVVIKEFDPIEKAQSYLMEQLQKGNTEFLNKIIQSTQIQELLQKYSQQIILGQFQNLTQLIDLVSTFIQIIEPVAYKFEKFISEKELNDVKDWVQEVQYQVNIKGNNGLTEESQNLIALFQSKINEKGYEFIELYNQVVMKYINDLLDKLRNFTKFKIQNFLEKNDEGKMSQDTESSDVTALIQQQVKEFKIFVQKSPIPDIIKGLIKSGGLETAKSLIQLFINQEDFAGNLLESFKNNETQINQKEDQVENVSIQNQEVEETKQNQEDKERQEIIDKLKEQSLIKAKNIIKNKLKSQQRNGKLIFKEQYIDMLIYKLESLKDLQKLQFTLKYELQKIIINQSLSPKTIESVFEKDQTYKQMQKNLIQKFYELNLKDLQLSAQKFKVKLKEEKVSKFLNKINEDLSQKEIIDLMNQDQLDIDDQSLIDNNEQINLKQSDINEQIDMLREFFSYIKLDEMFYDFESNFRYRVYKYQSQMIQAGRKKNNEFVMVKSIALKNISQNIWIEIKDYKDEIISQMYDIIQKEKREKEKITAEEAVKQDEGQDQVQEKIEADEDEKGPPDVNEIDPVEQKQTWSSVLNKFKFGFLIGQSQKVEEAQKIDDFQSNQDIQENNGLQSENINLIEKNVEPSDEIAEKKDEEPPGEIAEKKDEEPPEQNAVEQDQETSEQNNQASSLNDVLDIIEDQKIKEYIEKMEIQQLAVYMEKILKELTMDEVFGFLVDYLKDSGVSFFKEFVCDNMQQFIHGDFSGAKDLLQNQKDLFQDYGDDFQDVISNPEKIESGLLNCLQNYVVSPLYSWVSQKIPLIQQFITEEAWPKIKEVFKRYVINFLKQLGQNLLQKIKNIIRRYISRQTRINQNQGQISETQQSLIQNENNQRIQEVGQNNVERDNSVSPLV